MAMVGMPMLPALGRFTWPFDACKGGHSTGCHDTEMERAGLSQIISKRKVLVWNLVLRVVSLTSLFVNGRSPEICVTLTLASTTSDHMQL